MPYCDEHNEVYNAPECPVCAGGADADGSERDGGRTGGDSGGIGDVVDDALAAESSGDVVVGDQRKSVDRSTTVVDGSTTEVDESTTVEDSVVEGSSIGTGGEGDGGGRTVVDDSVVSDSTVGGSGETDVSDSVLNDATVGGERVESAVGDPSSEAPDPAEDDDAAFCIYCGTEIPSTAGFCPSCGEEQ